MIKFVESALEEAILEYLTDLGWEIKPGPEIGPEGARQEREDYLQVKRVLTGS